MNPFMQQQAMMAAQMAYQQMMMMSQNGSQAGDLPINPDRPVSPSASMGPSGFAGYGYGFGQPGTGMGGMGMNGMNMGMGGMGSMGSMGNMGNMSFGWPSPVPGWASPGQAQHGQGGVSPNPTGQRMSNVYPNSGAEWHGQGGQPQGHGSSTADRPRVATGMSESDLRKSGDGQAS
jgi:hypothetical protein